MSTRGRKPERRAACPDCARRCARARAPEQHAKLGYVQTRATPPLPPLPLAPSYALIGLEQTADSASLPAFVFPRRACLVLGREREGLPPELLGIMDHCVEIPQLGVIRRGGRGGGMHGGCAHAWGAAWRRRRRRPGCETEACGPPATGP